MLRTTAFPSTGNPAGIFIRLLFRSHFRFKPEDIHIFIETSEQVWQHSEIRRQPFCLSLTTRDTLFPLLFPAPRRAFHHQRMDLLDPDELQPEINVSFLMVEQGSGCR